MLDPFEYQYGISEGNARDWNRRMRSGCAATIPLISPNFSAQDLTPSVVVWPALRVTYLPVTVTFNCNERNSRFVCRLGDPDESQIRAGRTRRLRTVVTSARR